MQLLRLSVIAVYKQSVKMLEPFEGSIDTVSEAVTTDSEDSGTYSAAAYGDGIGRFNVNI